MYRETWFVCYKVHIINSGVLFKQYHFKKWLEEKMVSQYGCVSPWAQIDEQNNICQNLTLAREVYLIERFYTAGFDGNIIIGNI